MGASQIVLGTSSLVDHPVCAANSKNRWSVQDHNHSGQPLTVLPVMTISNL